MGTFVIHTTWEEAKAELLAKLREAFDEEPEELIVVCDCGLETIYPLCAFPQGNSRCYRCGSVHIEYVR